MERAEEATGDERTQQAVWAQNTQTFGDVYAYCTQMVCPLFFLPLLCFPLSIHRPMDRIMLDLHMLMLRHNLDGSPSLRSAMPSPASWTVRKIDLPPWLRRRRASSLLLQRRPVSSARRAQPSVAVPVLIPPDSPSGKHRTLVATTKDIEDPISPEEVAALEDKEGDDDANARFYKAMARTDVFMRNYVHEHGSLYMDENDECVFDNSAQIEEIRCKRVTAEEMETKIMKRELELSVDPSVFSGV
ncbi:hypothetical protein ZWY2020_059251 [Hordeum vulgare]|nr:hypothetical protein ZWY2020_059251 [Hordeum vulgare]